MILYCENCKYLFSSDKELEQCPDCGKWMVRIANDTEQEDYHRIQVQNQIDIWDIAAVSSI